jgi:hypothetical protein
MPAVTVTIEAQSVRKEKLLKQFVRRLLLTCALKLELELLGL